MYNYIEQQLASWQLAKTNYDRLALAERRKISLGDLTVGIQNNPERIRSTGASVDAESVKKRACFLCAANRPEEQFAAEIEPGWDLLVNPYPIFPVHFTIVYGSHEPQDAPPLDMASFAEKLPGTAVFFNGAKAGASAPDHLHCQAVLKDELPLLRLAEELHPDSESGWMLSSDSGKDLPFVFISCVIRPDLEGMRLLAAIPNVCGIDSESGVPDRGLVNTFFWIDASGILRVLIVPRRAHRPSCYFKEDPEKRVISPGAIDMAGIIVAPRKEDFNSISEAELREIYSEVAYSADIPESILEPLSDIERFR